MNATVRAAHNGDSPHRQPPHRTYEKLPLRLLLTLFPFENLRTCFLTITDRLDSSCIEQHGTSETVDVAATSTVELRRAHVHGHHTDNLCLCLASGVW